jgi:hypothetical protein
MPKRKTVKKTQKRTKRSAANKKRYSLLMFLSLVVIIIIFAISFYAILIFPKELNKKIKTSLIELLNPLSYDDTENALIIQINSRFNDDLKEKISGEIYDKFNLSVKFLAINNGDENGIIKIVFYQNDKELKDISNIYIYYMIDEDNTADFEEHSYPEKDKENSFLNNKKIQDKHVIKKNNAISYNNNYNKNQKNIYIKPVKIAIIIDDVGYDYNLTKELLNTGIPLTYAIIPDVEGSRISYDMIKQFNAEMMLHIPMEPFKGKQYVEKNALFTDMTEEELKNRINTFIREYPGIKGVNNHMGSKATNDEKVMNVLFEELSKNNLFWIDSMTSNVSKSKKIAAKYNMIFYKRNVFLDNKKDLNYMRNQMNILINYAKVNGYAIGIAHNQTKNLPVLLKEYYNKRHELGVEFITMTDIK